MEKCNRGFHISSCIRITPERLQLTTHIVNQSQRIAQSVTLCPENIELPQSCIFNGCQIIDRIQVKISVKVIR